MNSKPTSLTVILAGGSFLGKKAKMRRHGMVLAGLLLLPLWTSAAIIVDLADIVGHGDGSGTGTKGYGYHPNTGAQTTGTTGSITGDNGYHLVNDTDLIDGVFIPDGGAGDVQITSTDIDVTLGDTDNRSWDYIKYGPNRQSGSDLGGVDYNSGDHTMIGLHANKGITFDLDEIEKEAPWQEAARFTAVAGCTHSNNSTNIYVFVDGAKEFEVLQASANVAYDVDIALPTSARFLTLVATDRGNYSADQVLFGDPHVIPEPAGATLLLAGISLLVLRRRRQ